MEFVIGGLAATSAGFFTNPLEVAKHHMELNKKTQYTDYKYKNLLRSGYAVVKTNGLKSLQKGLSPALGAHLASYGMKLGTYQFGANRGLTTNANGDIAIPKSVLMSGAGGVLGQYMSSPFYLLKIQHDYQTTATKTPETYTDTVKKIYREHGIRGFFRGATASMPRAFIGTSQLTSFAVAKESLSKFDTFKDNLMLATFIASNLAGLVLSLAMTPFDMVLTKLYKQAINAKTATDGIYAGFLDCVQKTYKAKGFKPFYKEFGPIYLKLGPHTVLCLVFWEEFKSIYDSRNVCDENFYQNKFGFASSREFLAAKGNVPQEENDFCWN